MGDWQDFFLPNLYGSELKALWTAREWCAKGGLARTFTAWVTVPAGETKDYSWGSPSEGKYWLMGDIIAASQVKAAVEWMVFPPAYGAKFYLNPYETGSHTHSIPFPITPDKEIWLALENHDTVDGEIATSLTIIAPEGFTKEIDPEKDPVRFLREGMWHHVFLIGKREGELYALTYEMRKAEACIMRLRKWEGRDIEVEEVRRGRREEIGRWAEELRRLLRR